MRFVDLNNDILGMIGHKVFLRKLIQHRHNDFHFDKIDWTHWESKHNLDVFFLNDGYSGCSYPPEFEDEDYDLKLITDYEVYSDYSD